VTLYSYQTNSATGAVMVPLKALPAGVYMVTLTAGNEKTTKRLVKE
ncbi:MAG: T9SS C-terminal target domain-containing protein, partial [Chitinophagia bacterium]|nr:T9SS C-terminal target domain-containing protein [Chitinophagia bacterium]